MTLHVATLWQLQSHGTDEGLAQSITLPTNERLPPKRLLFVFSIFWYLPSPKPFSRFQFLTKTLLIAPKICQQMCLFTTSVISKTISSTAFKWRIFDTVKGGFTWRAGYSYTYAPYFPYCTYFANSLLLNMLISLNFPGLLATSTGMRCI